jgi:carbonic anhydrase/acetyltransferase-like protein (isoleucine patch superfamily)
MIGERMTAYALDDISPQLPPEGEYWIAPNASVIGNVILHRNASVWFGAVLRGDRAAIRLGERSNIQDNVSVHCDPGTPTTIGAGVSVGHGAVVHGCTIEADCLIGMNATVLNRAVIGAGSLVAAGAVVLEDTVVPPGSLVAGVPAKVRRELSAEERARLRANADTYVGLRADYLPR